MGPQRPFRGQSMLREIEGLAAASRSNTRLQFSSLVTLSILALLVCLSPGCGAASQAGTGMSSRIALSMPSQAAVVGTPYNAVANVSGGTTPYSFSIATGKLPPGTTLNTQTGAITGVPSVAGIFTAVLSVADATARSRAAAAVRISVAPKAISASQAHITISPASASVASKGTEQFTAAITGSSNTAVVWSATAGTISSTGKFTAPAVTSNTSVTVTATSQASSRLNAAATINVTPLPVLAIETNSIPEANKGAQYSEPLAASGGTSPYKWNISAGALPSGIQLSATGTISGTTAYAGKFPFTAKVTDTHGSTATRSYTLSVSSSSASGFDGPAELPRVWIQTAMANTPVPGNTITVNSGGNLQAALNTVNCGETILLQAGATFTGQFTFPKKSCDDAHWIIVRTSAEDSLLSPEGTRLTPCFAGVSSLPGRPMLNCSSTKNVLARLLMNQAGNGPVFFAAGANHYRFVGLELTRSAGVGQVSALASAPTAAAYNNVIFDRVWIHGTAQDETRRGLQLGNSTYVSVIDSYFTDFHCVNATGSCTDSQAIAGGNGAGPMGPYKISGNFLEAGAENIIFGGGPGTATPTDIEVSRNHLFKPLTWMQGQPGYVGGTDGNPFIVKNLFELKNAQRVLLEGNVLEHTWGGFSQEGFAIVLTPKNPGANTCPVCQVTDVTIRYNHISHVGAGLEIANVVPPSGSSAVDGQRYSIHDIVVDDIDGSYYRGAGEFAEIIVNPGAPLLQNVAINHITAFPPKTLFVIGDQVAYSTKMKNFVFSNSIVTAGTYPVWSSGNGGTANCAYFDKPLTTFNACFSPYSFVKNVVIGAPSTYPSSMWPAGNYFPTAAGEVRFVSYNDGKGGDYALMGTSTFTNAGTDGKPLGADIAQLESATAGVN
jgi:hypothetical protein